MRRGLLTIAMFTALSGFAQSQQCEGKTKLNVQCKQTVVKGKLCYNHDPNYVKKIIAESTICTSKTKANIPCKMKTRHVSGICYHHRPKND